MPSVHLRSHWVFVAVTVVIALCLPFSSPASCGADEEQGRDWQAWADGARWKFEVDEAQPLYCAIKKNGKFGAYEIGIRVQKGGHNVCIDVIDEQVVKHSWMGHRNSVFVIRDKRLYYADFGRGSTGASVVAVDLDTGQLLWRERCRGSAHRRGTPATAPSSILAWVTT